MDFSTMCRTCMSSNELLPIFETFDDKKRSAALFIISGVKVELDDGLPQHMCSTCVNHLKNSVRFRHQCQKSEIKLLELKLDIDSVPKHLKVEMFKEGTDVKEEDLATNDGAVVKADFDEIHPKLESESEDADTIKTEYLTMKPEDAPLPTTELNQKAKRDRSRVTCKYCLKELSVQSLDGHIARTHPSVDERRTKCEECGRFIVKEKMNRHVMMMHAGTFKCTNCSEEFETKPLLVQHKPACTGARKRRKNRNESNRELVECEHCHKAMQRASLKIHVRIKHAGLGPVCEHCGRKFGNKRRLDEHLRAKHGHDKFKCSYCEFSSAAITALHNHERRHRGEKPFVCEECGAKFHAAYLLAQHKQSHRTDKLIKCDQCTAVFKASNGLHIHRSTVHGGSLHRCLFCARRYSCRHYAVKHLRAVHRFKGPVPPLEVVTNTNDAEKTKDMTVLVS